MMTRVVNVRRVMPLIIDAAPISAKIPGDTSKSGFNYSRINSAYNLPNADPKIIQGTKKPIGIDIP